MRRVRRYRVVRPTDRPYLRCATAQLQPVTTFCTSSSRADTARTRRRCIRLCARSRSAPRARRAAGARHGKPSHRPAVVARPGEGGAHYAEPPPPASSPLPRPGPPGPSGGLICGHCISLWQIATSGGAGRTGSKRLDPGAPATPRLAIAGRPEEACRRRRAPPSPSHAHASF
jgi:hypothetical protein